MRVNMQICIQTWQPDNFGHEVCLYVYMCMFSYRKESENKTRTARMHQETENIVHASTNTHIDDCTHIPRHTRTMGMHIVPQGRQWPRGSAESRQWCKYWCMNDSCPCVFVGLAYVYTCTDTHVGYVVSNAYREEMLFIGIQMEDQVWSPAQLSPLKDTQEMSLFMVCVFVF